MKSNSNEIYSRLRDVITTVEEKNLQKSHGITAKLSPLEDVIDGMIGNASMNLGGASVENVFANWGSAQHAADVYADPKTNPDARPLSDTELKQLDRYITDAKEITINRTDKSARVIATDGGLILQLGKYGHDYSDEEQAAHDWNEFLKTRDTEGWEGHDSVAAEETVDDHARAAGVRDFDEADVAEALAKNSAEVGPLNFRCFIEALGKLQIKSRAGTVPSIASTTIEPPEDNKSGTNRRPSISQQKVVTEKLAALERVIADVQLRTAQHDEYATEASNRENAKLLGLPKDEFGTRQRVRPVKFGPVDGLISGMIWHAQEHLGGVSVPNVFGHWKSAQDAVDAFNADGNQVPKLSGDEIRQLDRYIADAKTLKSDAAPRRNRRREITKHSDVTGTGLFGGSRFAGSVDVNALAAEEAKQKKADMVRNLVTAIENKELEVALKVADRIGSRKEIASIAEDHEITVPGQKNHSPDEPVLRRLDELCEDHFLAVLNADLTEAGVKPCDRESYGQPMEWEPGLKSTELDQLAKGCAETFIDQAEPEPDQQERGLDMA